jgi:threonine/homoserine/homoserine lactone efflux protein
METDLILALTLAGITLGVVEGIKPGPLLTMVIKETLSGGLRAGAWTAAAPIFTDGPLVIISLFAAGWFATQPMALFVISIVGALFLIKMGIDCFSIDPPIGDELLTDAKGAFQRGILTNLLNPNVYVFWFLIGGPLMASVAEDEPLAPIAYALSFLISIILVKTFIAYIFDKTRGNISAKSYKTALSLCGIAMLIFAAGFLNQGIGIWTNGF